MKTSESRILTTHMGSLPRGEVLSDLLIRKDNEEAVDEARLANEVAAAMQHVVDRQLACGVDVGNDGEQPRVSFQTYVTSRMSGFGGEGKRPMPLETKLYPKWAELLKTRRAARSRVYNPPAAIAGVRYEDFSGVEAECAGFRRCLDASQGAFLETFMTAASPGVVTTTMMNHHYASHEEYLFAVAREIAKEYRYIADQGFVLQIDAPDLAMERASFFQDLSLAEFQGRVVQHIEAINLAIEGIPRDRVRLHSCWGNRDGPHTEDVALEHVLPHLLEARVGAICLPFANPRHSHEVEVLGSAAVPDDLVVVAGVVESTNNYVEHPEVVRRRILEAARALGDRERLIAGVDCGFGTFAGDSFVAEDVVWAKLATLAEGRSSPPLISGSRPARRTRGWPAWWRTSPAGRWRLRRNDRRWPGRHEERFALNPYRSLFAVRSGAEPDGGRPRADSEGREGSA